MQRRSTIRYSATYEDETFQYRHVIVEKHMLSMIPKNRLMDECEWRAVGIQQGSHWEHYLIHRPEPYVLLFRRLLKYRHESDPSIDQQQSQNSHFPTTRVPRSGSKATQPLADSTNTKTTSNAPFGFRLSFNVYK